MCRLRVDRGEKAEAFHRGVQGSGEDKPDSTIAHELPSWIKGRGQGQRPKSAGKPVKDREVSTET